MSVPRRFFGYLFRPGGTKHALVMALHDQWLAAVAEEALGGLRGGRLLDIGCGGKPYREMLKPYVAEHVGLDVQDTRYDPGAADLVGTAEAIPAADASFDVTLCTSTLEHTPDPARAVREQARVLRPGGVAISSVPLFWHLHDEPHDYQRFTRFALQYLYGEAGFVIDRIQPVGLFWATVVTMLCYRLMRFHRGVLRLLPVIPLVCGVLQCAGFVMDMIDRPGKWVCLYLLVAHKPRNVEGLAE